MSWILTIKDQIAGVEEREVPLEEENYLDDVPSGLPDMLNLQSKSEKVVPDKEGACSHCERCAPV